MKSRGVDWRKDVSMYKAAPEREGNAVAKANVGQLAGVMFVGADPTASNLGQYCASGIAGVNTLTQHE
jgi:hypothetical protein